VTGLIKLALQAGKANPAPPVGPALGAKVTCLFPVATCVRCRPQECKSWAIFTYGAVHSELAEHCLQGVNIMAFCKEYNAATQDKVGTVIPVEITVFEVGQCSSAALPTDWCIHVHHS